ncbi:GGDEF domain-containing response regulator [Marinicellulosiphila megalodicopiae]|uniref:GGDEF domain-containing response regulator n=1 Tax=Marinicellulosiphila megalodicopiae TaxID=2724896 RepID=UPI003BB06FC7
MKKILIIEDSPIIIKIIRHLAKQVLQLPYIFAQSFSETKVLLENKDDYFAAIVDLNLPDAPNGEVVQYCLEKHLPVVVLTGSVDEERRKALFDMGVVDYVVKDGKYSYQFALKLINQLQLNQSINVMVVDDSKPARHHMQKLLSRLLFNVFEAEDGQQALDILAKNSDINLMITDYYMPNVDGFELVKQIRNKYEKNDLMIIGLSGAEEKNISAKFIKQGANDFLGKPFIPEEFNCRILANTESMYMWKQLKEMAYHDHLTHLYNENYFIEQGKSLVSHANKQQSHLSMVYLKLDHLLDIEDRFGEENYHHIVKSFAQGLAVRFKKFVCTRISDDTFGLLLAGINHNQAMTLMETFLEQMNEVVFEMEGHEVFVQFSAGVSSDSAQGFEGQLEIAISRMHIAIEEGRNQVRGGS